ncbi:hypothetical protein DL93DRAFT_2162649 [Clavulina sp. PMI_390]|nr:hypothetical protein DL93DRAFT_2162649 [Clavulina sp. PMI_390]
MDEAWCPVCDRLIPPNRIQIAQDDSLASAANPDTTTSSASSSTNAPQEPTTTQAAPPPPPAATKRTRSKPGVPGGRRSKLANATHAPAGAAANTTKAKANPPPAAAPTTTSDAPSATDDASGGADSAATPNKKPSKARTVLTQSASLYCSERCRLADELNYAHDGSGVAGVIDMDSLISPSSSYNSTMQMGLQMPFPASSYHASGSYTGVVGATTSTPGAGGPSAGASVSMSAAPSLTKAAAAGGGGRKRTQSSLSRHASSVVINTALANSAAPLPGSGGASTSNSKPSAPYYLASPLLSPVLPPTQYTRPQSQSHSRTRKSSHSRSQSRRASYSRAGGGNASDDEASSLQQHQHSHSHSYSQGPTPAQIQVSAYSYFPGGYTYAYDPDRANGDYFRSLRRGEKQGYFFTTPTPLAAPGPALPPHTPTSPTASADIDGADNKKNRKQSSSSKRHSVTALPGGSQSHHSSHHRSSSASLTNYSAMASTNRPRPTRAQSSSASVSLSSSRFHRGSSIDGENEFVGAEEEDEVDEEEEHSGTSAPAYVPTNGYLNQIQMSSVSGVGRLLSTTGHYYDEDALGYPYVHPYPDRPPYHSSSSRRGASASSSTSSRRQHPASYTNEPSRMRELEDDEETAGQRRASSHSRAHPNSSSRNRSSQSYSQSALSHLQSNNKRHSQSQSHQPHSNLPLFALEPHYPGPLSSTSEESGTSEDEAHRRSTSLGIGMGISGRSRRRSSHDTNRPESMTTAPSTESVKELINNLGSETTSGSAAGIVTGMESMGISVSPVHVAVDGGAEMKRRNVLPRPVRVRSSARVPTIQADVKDEEDEERDGAPEADTASNGTGTDATPRRRPVPSRRSTVASSITTAVAELEGTPSSAGGTARGPIPFRVPSAFITPMPVTLSTTAPADPSPISFLSPSAGASYRPNRSSSAASLPFAPLSTSPSILSTSSASTVVMPRKGSTSSTFSMPADPVTSTGAAKFKHNGPNRPEHQHGLLVHVALPSTTRSPSASYAHLRSKSLGLMNPQLGGGAGGLVAPSVSNVDVTGTLSPTSTASGPGLNPPVQDVLPPRNDARSRSQSLTRSRLLLQHQQQQQQLENYVLAHGGSEGASPNAGPSAVPRTVSAAAVGTKGMGVKGGNARSPSRTPAQSFRSHVRLESLDEVLTDQDHDGPTPAPALGGGKQRGAASRKPSPSSRKPSVTDLPALGAGVPVGVGIGGVGLDLETFVPTYPMEMLPGQPGEKRKR